MSNSESLKRMRGIFHNSSETTRKLVEDYSIEELSLDLNLYSDNKLELRLIRWYERLIMLCKLDFTRYQGERFDEHLKIIEFIEKNNLRHAWARLINHALNTADSVNMKSGDSRYIAGVMALHSEIGDTWMLMTHDRPTLVCGVTRDGSKFLECGNPYYRWSDEHNRLVMMRLNRKITDDQFKKSAQKLVDNGLYSKIEHEKEINRCVFNMIPFLNEKSLKILPIKWTVHHENKLPSIRPYFRDPQVFDKMLLERKRTLNSEGVLCTFKNTGNISALFLMEDMSVDNEFYVAFRFDFIDGTSTCGSYIPATQSIFMGYQTHTDPHVGHVMLFLFEVYADLTHGFEKNFKRKYALVPVEDINDPSLNTTNIYVNYSIHVPAEGEGTRRKGFKQSPHHRKMATRKLPPGRTPSARAIAEAKRHGIDLEPGKTFVRTYDVLGFGNITNPI